MQKRRIGNTGLEVSVIGLGTVKFGRNEQVKYPYPFSLPNDSEIKNLLAQAFEWGINLIDTAPAYGTSEERLGKLLGTERHRWIISTKVGEQFINGISTFDFSKDALKKSISQSLKRLKTDYLDIVLVHSDGKDEEHIEQAQIFLTLNDLKKEGKIRAYGMSTKTVRGGMLTLDQADIAMITLNPIYQEEQDVIHYASRLKKSIFVKKGLASGHLQKIGTDDPVSHAMQFIFAHPGVTSVIIGTLNPSHLQEIVEKASAAIRKS